MSLDFFETMEFINFFTSSFVKTDGIFFSFFGRLMSAVISL
jgi:hypothetical protein